MSLKPFWDFFNPLLRPPAWQAQDQIDPSQNDSSKLCFLSLGQ